MDRAPLAIATAAFLAGAYLLATWVRDQQASDAGDSYTDLADTSTDATPDTSTEEDILTTIQTTITRKLGLWHAPAQYAPAIAAAETRYAIPAQMLERLLYQECRYRDDIITGRTTSPVGAQGIAQFMPATAREMGIDPLDPDQAIDGAGRYLSRLYRATGTWSKALASYNWGQGNVQRKGLDAAPKETRNYYSQILADVNASTGSTYA